MKIIQKITVRIAKIILWFVLCLLFMILSVYMLCPVYHFPETQPFSGNKIFNPYQEVSGNYWKKCNFHVHSRAWGGITAGSENSSQKIFGIYHQLGYDHLSISDYMRINTYQSGDSHYLPGYEHGFGMGKNHQLIIGAKNVLWFDFPFLQNRHNKQFVLNHLKGRSQLYFIAHPEFNHSYPPDDFRYLTNYDGVEVLNHFRISDRQWDAALSVGHYLPLIADDDGHDISNPNEAGRCFTMIDAPSGNPSQLVASLKAGRTYGVADEKYAGLSYEQKAERFKNIPFVKKISINNDSLIVEVSEPASEIRFIGQNGVKKMTIAGSRRAAYFISPADTYIRTEVLCNSGFHLYLNPVFRYSGDQPKAYPLATVDWLWTSVLRLLFVLIVIIIVSYFKQKRRKHSKHEI